MMSNQVVLITGSSGGLGSVIARSFAAKGYRLALHYFRQTEEVRKLETELGPQAKAFEADLRNPDQIALMVEQVAEHFGRIDMLINNAGVAFSSISWKQELSDWNEVMSINTDAPFLVSKACIPHLRKQTHARIVHISSIVANRPLAGTSAYAASKGAVQALTRAQAVELARFGITVNCIAPGYFEAGMIRTIDEPAMEKLLEEIPLHRLGKPEELAECLLYLCSEGAAYLTGQVIHLNGGLLL